MVALLLGGCTTAVPPTLPPSLSADPTLSPVAAPVPASPAQAPPPPGAEGTTSTTTRVVTKSPKVISTVRVLGDIPYASVGSLLLRLDIYRRVPDISQPRSGVMLVHGGGWGAYIEHPTGGGVEDTPGTKEQMARIAKRFAARGAVVFAIEYRWACSGTRIPPNAPTPAICGNHAPAQNLDVDTALGWIRANAAVLGVDPSRRGTFGIGAGGHLVLMNAATGANRPQAVATWSAVTDLPSCKLTRSCQPVTAYIGAKLEERPDLWSFYSPVEAVSGPVPPLYMANGAREVTALSQATAFRDRVEGLGSEVTLRVIEGERATADGMRLEGVTVGKGRTVLDETISFLLETL